MIKKRKKTATGLDISDRSVELVQLDLNGKKINMRASIRVEFPEGTILRGEIKDHIAFDRVMNDCLDKAEKLNFSFDNLVVSLPEELVLNRIVEIEPQEKKEVEALVLEKLHNELAKLSEQWQYEIFEVTIKDKPKYLYYGIGLNKLSEFVRTIEEFGLDVDYVEPESTALIRNINKKEKENIIIDFSAHSTTFYYYVNGLIYNKKTIDFGGDLLIDDLSKISKLGKDKEAKFFHRVGYGERTTVEQKKIIEDKFSSFNDELLLFINDIEKEYGFKAEEIFVTGGLSRMIGLNDLILPQIKIKKINPLVKSLDVKDSDYLTAVGCAVRGLYRSYYASDINFFNQELKEKIDEEVENEFKSKQEEIIKQEISKSEGKETSKTKDLKNLLSEKWGIDEEKKRKWGISFRLTGFAQILFLLVICNIGMIVLAYYTTNESIKEREKENKLIDEGKAREFITYNFPLIVSSGESLGDTTNPAMFGRFQEYVIELKDTFIPTGGKVTQEDLDNALKTLEKRVRRGEGYENYITLEEGEFLIANAAVYEQAFAGADKEVGIEADQFEYTLKAKVEFAIVSKQAFDLIVKMRLETNLRTSENVESYTNNAVSFLIIEYIKESNIAKFNVNVESETNN